MDQSLYQKLHIHIKKDFTHMKSSNINAVIQVQPRKGNNYTENMSQNWTLSKLTYLTIKHKFSPGSQSIDT